MLVSFESVLGSNIILLGVIFLQTSDPYGVGIVGYRQSLFLPLHLI